MKAEYFFLENGKIHVQAIEQSGQEIGYELIREIYRKAYMQDAENACDVAAWFTQKALHLTYQRIKSVIEKFGISSDQLSLELGSLFSLEEPADTSSGKKEAKNETKETEPSSGCSADGQEQVSSEDDPEVKKGVALPEEKSKRRRQGLSVARIKENLPKEKNHIFPEDMDLSKAVQLAPTIKEEIVYVPARYYVKQNIVHNYLSPDGRLVCHSKEAAIKAEEQLREKGYTVRLLSEKENEIILEAEKTNEKGDPVPVFFGAACPRLIDGSCLSESLAARIIYDHVCSFLPIHRETIRFGHEQVPFREQTISEWFQQVTSLYLSVVSERILQDFKKCGYIHADETHITVQETKRKGKGKRDHYLVMNTAACEKNPMAIYRYMPDKKKGFLNPFLGDSFDGVMLTDGLLNYSHYPARLHCRCLAHAMRKFSDLIKARSREMDKLRAMSQEERDAYLAKPEHRTLYEILYILDQFRQIYHNDNIAADPEQRRKIRQEKSVLCYEEILSHCAYILSQGSKSSPVYKAASYFDKGKHEFGLFLLDENIPLDNNSCEIMTRNISLLRKNSSSLTSVNGAILHGHAFTVVVSATLNGLNPYLYLEYLLHEMKGQKITDELLERLLPYSDQLPEYLYDKNSIYYQIRKDILEERFAQDRQ